MANKSTQNLFNLSDKNVISTVQSVFTQQLKNSGAVKSLFFKNTPAPAKGAVNAGWTNDIAIALVSSSISSSSLYGFNKSINQSKANNYWQSRLAAGNADSVASSQDLYNWAFPAHCNADGLTFSDYLNDNPSSWGEQLATAISETSFINTTVAKIIASDATWLKTLNLAFYKIHRLKPDAVTGVVDAWSKAFPAKGITANWQTYNFIPHNIYQTDEFIGAVNTAITSDKKTDSGSNVTPWGPVDNTKGYWFGNDVKKFVETQSQSLGLYTGDAPDNFVKKKTFGCFVKGTSLHLQDHTTIPIEQAKKGDKILGKDGEIGIHSDEKVVQTLQDKTLIFGFNAIAPFFLGSHPFWTQEGWKALYPEVAMEENPSRKIDQLEKGDIIYQITSTNPMKYAEVEIKSITMKTLEAGEQVYGQHFMNGASSYHANGFLVAMNYPQITAGRIKKGMAKLSPSERRLISEAMEPILPLLGLALGGFVEEPLREAFSQ